MTRYVFIESRDPFESRDTQFLEDTAVAVKERGHGSRCFWCKTACSRRARALVVSGVWRKPA